ncbi:MAG: hypothetical protein U1E76_03585 [Planctomycetota bacterium]
MTVAYTVSDNFSLDGWDPGDVPQNGGHWETDTDGVQTFYRNYLAWADVNAHNARTRGVRIVEAALTPIFQYAVFYDNDLEILPGQNMTLSGRVHSNSNIYVGTGAGKTLTINSDYFKCAGSIFRQRKDTAAPSDGTVQIKVKNKGLFYQMLNKAQMQLLGIPSTSGFDSLFQGYDKNQDGDLADNGDYPDFTVGAVTLWEGSVGDQGHGVKRHEPPSIGNIKMYSQKASDEEWGDYNYDATSKQWVAADPPGSGQYNKGNYFANAGLTIVQDPKNPGTWIAKNQSGVTVNLRAGTLTNRTMYDAREGKTVQVVDVDMSLLTKDYDANADGDLNDPGDFVGKSGLIYVGRRDCWKPEDSSYHQPNGIRLRNGTTLKAGTTVVSEDPVYVWGDYNTVEKKPAAVIADAVNLLSNGWTNSKSKGQLPAARATTFNFAMITGADSTQGSSYCGGFENLPRFHEDWTGVTCKIRGSFVNIFKSEIARGAWVYGGDHYTAPNRDWDYDPSFNDPSKLPPFTPVAGSIRTTITIANPPPGWPPQG